MPGPLIVASPLGELRLRPESGADAGFRLELFRRSRPQEWDQLPLPPAVLDQIMRQQFQAQSVSYLRQFPHARFDIIELDGRPIGRMVVDRPGDQIHLVDLAITPDLRDRGLGTALLKALMDEAGEAGAPVVLEVASSNDPSMRLYRRLGFAVTDETAMYLQMTWSPRG
jgi:ribosomal protein S18 acetylase RimI-like enzyme